MSLAALRRDVGAYGDVVLDRLGFLFLQSAVAAGLRIRDGNLYEPDPSLIPRDVRAVHRELRLRWRQERALARAVASWARDEGHPELRFTAETGELNGWSDPLPLARLAVALRPGDPLARLALFTNLFRSGQVQAAGDQLSVASAQYSVASVALRTRILRSQSILLDFGGDLAGAASTVLVCIRVAPTSACHHRDYLAYSVATANDQVALHAARRLISWFGLYRAQLAFAAVWARCSAKAGHVLRTSPELAGMACAELHLTSPASREFSSDS